MDELCEWHRDSKSKECSCPDVLEYFWNKNIHCSGKPETIKGKRASPLVQVFTADGKLVCKSFCSYYQKSPGTSLILIVDDDIEVCKSIRDAIKREGYNVDISTSGAEALEKVKKDRPDLIILDVRMPEMNGVQTLKAIKEIDDTIPVIMLSGYGDVDLAEESFRLSAYDYVSKPIDFEYLKASILSKVFPNEE